MMAKVEGWDEHEAMGWYDEMRMRIESLVVFVEQEQVHCQHAVFIFSGVLSWRPLFFFLRG